MKIRHGKWFLPLFIVCFFWSCNDDEPIREIPKGQDGFFVVNEGAFGNSNASLSFFDRENGVMNNNIFNATNGFDLGDQAQSMTLFDTLAFVVVQNSGKIEVMHRQTFESLATIDDDITSPRYLTVVDNEKAYISDWVDGFSGVLHVLDIPSFEITSTINIGAGPNEITLDGNTAYVALNGGFGNDNRIAVLNTTTDAITGYLETRDNPNVVVLVNNKLWIAGRGKTAYNPDFSIDEANSAKSYLARLDKDGTEELYLEAPDFTLSNVGNFVYNELDNEFYFTYNGAVYRFDTGIDAFPSTAFINQSFYGLGYDPIEDALIGLETPDFSSSGNLIYFDDNGNSTKTFTVGIGPNSIVLD